MAKWRIYVLENWFIIVLDGGLSLIQHQIIMQCNRTNTSHRQIVIISNRDVFHQEYDPDVIKYRFYVILVQPWSSQYGNKTNIPQSNKEWPTKYSYQVV